MSTDKPLEDIQDELLDLIHAGEAIDRDAVLAAHPAHADSLRRFFALLDEIEQPPPVAAPAQLRLGEFRLLREIGRGGMGVVHEAEQTSLKRRVALKVLPAVLAANPRVVARFRREAEAAGRLRHPNIVPVYAVGDEGGVPFFAMELVEGRSLAELLAARIAGTDDALPAAGAPWRAWAVRTVVAIADALEYAHEQGILHRDVKPGNILLEADGTPRLTDFGLALDLDAPGLTMSGETFGTPLYMSPEQAIRREAPLDRRTDVYSLGVTLYEALTLRTPYEGTSMVEVIAALRSGRIVQPREADPDLPEALETILLRALATDVQERYPSAAEFATDLRAGMRTGLRRASVPGVSRARGPARRSRLAYAAAAAVVGVLALGVAFWRDDAPGTVSSGDSTERMRAAPEHAVHDWDAVLASVDGAEELLREALSYRIEMRSVVSRADPGMVRLHAAIDGGRPAGDADMVLYRTWEAQIDGGDWRVLRRELIAPSPEGEEGRVIGIGMREILGAALAHGSVSVGLRARTRAIRRPPTMERFMGGGTFVDPPEEWMESGGSIVTWEHQQPVLVYDEFPADYPRSVTGDSIDASMRRSLSPARIGELSIGSLRRFNVDLCDLRDSGPVPTACAIELRRPGSDVAIATAEITREATVEGAEPRLHTEYNVSFWLSDPPSADEQRFALDVAARRVDRVRLVFRGSRRVALEKTAFDSYWGGELDVTLPVSSFVLADDLEAFDGEPTGPIVLGEPNGSEAPSRLSARPWPDPAAITRNEFEQLLAGTHADGEAALRSWVEPRVRARSVMTFERASNCWFTLMFQHGHVVPGVDAERATLVATWEIAVAGEPWQPLDTNRVLLVDGSPFVSRETAWGGDVFGEAVARGSADYRVRVEFWLVNGPVPVGGRPAPTQEEWDAVADQGTRCTVEFERSVRFVATPPDDHPRPLADARTRAAVERWLRAPSFSLSNIGTLDLRLDTKGAPPVPIVASVLVFDPSDGRQVGHATSFVSSPDGANWRSISVKLNKPVPQIDRDLAAALRSGEKTQLRFVIRGDREAVLAADEYGLVEFDEYWDGRLDVTLPLRHD